VRPPSLRRWARRERPRWERPQPQARRLFPSPTRWASRLAKPSPLIRAQTPRPPLSPLLWAAGEGAEAAEAPHGGPPWRLIGFARGGTYALFETAAGLVLLDRRAAEERIWFERLLGEFRAGSVQSQRLLLPAALELDPVASALLLDHREFLRSHGFDVAEFGRNFYRLEAAPAWLEPGEAEPFLRDLLDALRDGRLADRNTDLARDELARLAASKAVRLQANPGEIEMKALLAELFSTRSPLAGPTGRPTFIEIGEAELARRLQKS